MKSKPSDTSVDTVEERKTKNTYNFVKLYKSAAESRVPKPKTVENLDTRDSVDSPNKKKEKDSHNKKKKKGGNVSLNISDIKTDENGLEGKVKSSLASDSRATSTPVAGRSSRSTEPKVKSIMKNSVSNTDGAMDDSGPDTPSSKPKKRNKSVSFMLDENEEIATKKTRSEDSVRPEKKGSKGKEKLFDKKAFKKLKKESQAEKENQSKINLDTDQSNENTNKTKKREKSRNKSDAEASSDVQPEAQEMKKRVKKLKKRKKEVDEEIDATENDSNNNEESNEQKPRKFKKKKRSKSQPSEENEGEPASKVKKEVKEVAEDLENLSIGDNAHTLSNLLDEMMVVDKDKRKKSKVKHKKEKAKPSSVSSSETADLEKIEEGKEKVKWRKRKWNKDKKGDVDEDLMATSVIVENLPLKIMCNYKKELSNHFEKLGLIKRIGIAEVYPTEEPKPVFTTTIVFYSEGAAAKALEEDNTLFEGSRIRVKRPLPPTQTTVVVRSYADLSEQSLSSAFSAAGRIRGIRQLVKGRKSFMTAFIEFDGPEAVARALKMAEEARIGGKKVHAARFERRGRSHKERRLCRGDSDNEGDSEDSND